MSCSCRPHLERYKQQLQQQGLELPPLPAVCASYFDSSSGSSNGVAQLPSFTGSKASLPGSRLTVQHNSARSAEGSQLSAADNKRNQAQMTQQSQHNSDGAASAIDSLKCTMLLPDSPSAAVKTPAATFSPALSCTGMNTANVLGSVSQQKAQLHVPSANPKLVGAANHTYGQCRRSKLPWLFCCTLSRSTKSSSSVCGSNKHTSKAMPLELVAVQTSVSQRSDSSQLPTPLGQLPADDAAPINHAALELQLLQPLRHTLSTVLSSEASTVQQALCSAASARGYKASSFTTSNTVVASCSAAAAESAVSAATQVLTAPTQKLAVAEQQAVGSVLTASSSNSTDQQKAVLWSATAILASGSPSGITIDRPHGVKAAGALQAIEDTYALQHAKSNFPNFSLPVAIAPSAEDGTIQSLKAKGGSYATQVFRALTGNGLDSSTLNSPEKQLTGGNQLSGEQLAIQTAIRQIQAKLGVRTVRLACRAVC
eukprot:GHRR01024505.1.p1 GENE.GHRR01024505.1~~GHRR01024505.1.p1  ORF type:complete len:484 (+),score=177.57 GHRR01024505.1:2584-4035(+)